MKDSRQSAVFGRRKEPHTIIIARGDQIRHFTVRPWTVALAASVFSAIAIGYLLATSYLVLRDDLLGATAARQARMQQAYEDRISALRAQVDRITSRQLLDQQLMESKVSELLDRQKLLTQRHSRIGPILDRAEQEPGALPGKAPLPAGKPDTRAEAPAPIQTASITSLAEPSSPLAALSFWNHSESAPGKASDADRADRLFVAINQSLRNIESEQLTRIDTLAQNADQTADAIKTALEDAGLPIDLDYGKEAVGGPLLPVSGRSLSGQPLFEARVQELDDALDRLDELKGIARKLPIANPAPGDAVSSGFGVRTDPLLGRPALHSGIDFRATMGSDALATAPGTVIHAGWNGGYGQMVEVDHGNGLTTRYAHLSKILVKVGDQVKRGDTVGATGSTGRSTGPHLHYEIRRNGEAINPVGFLKAGRQVSGLL